MDRKTEKRVIFILLTAAFLSVVVTAVTLIFTRPPLTEPAITVWRLTEEEVQYQSRININEATVSQLAMAEGIGPVIAQDIYDYIRANGPISDLTQLDHVDGVGEKRVEALSKIFYAGQDR